MKPLMLTSINLNLKNTLLSVRSSTMSDEYRILDADQPRGDFKLFQERIRGVDMVFLILKIIFTSLPTKMKRKTLN